MSNEKVPSFYMDLTTGIVLDHVSDRNVSINIECAPFDGLSFKIKKQEMRVDFTKDEIVHISLSRLELISLINMLETARSWSEHETAR